MHSSAITLLLAIFGAVSSAAQPIPGLEVAARWSPMKGSAPAAPVEISGRETVRLRCNFAGTKLERAAWDSDVTIDLATARGLQFQFYCADPSPVSGFVCHLRSGGGWYSVPFSGGGANTWDTIVIPKLASDMEGKPEGWSRIDRIRLSAWRGGETDTEFFVSGFQIIPGGNEILVLREESGQ